MTTERLLFTDLDGTLLDHYTYQPGPSLGAMRRLAQRGIQVIFCSSKTFAEQRHLQRLFGLHAPFIFENGSAVALPENFFSIKKYAVWLRADGFEMVRLAHAEIGGALSLLQNLPGVRGFSSATNQELAAATVLSGEALARARERWFTETLLWPNDDAGAAAVARMLTPAGWVLSRGGRFFTVQSGQVDKGGALRFLLDIFRQNVLDPIEAAAVGDSPNDAPMLTAVPQAFLVQRPGGYWASVETPDAQRVKGVGPAGFCEVARLLCAH